MRHFIPHFTTTMDDSHRETGELQSTTQVTPEPELVTCQRCRDYMRSKGITKRIDDTDPINMDAVPVSPFKNWMG